MIHPADYLATSIIFNTILLLCTTKAVQGGLLGIPTQFSSNGGLMSYLGVISGLTQLGLLILSILYFGFLKGSFAFVLMTVSGSAFYALLGQLRWFSIYLFPIIEPILIWQAINNIPN